MKKLSLAVLCLAAAVMPATLPAAPVAGDSEVQISGGGSHTQGSDQGAFNFDLGYGYFLTPGLELGLRQGLSYTFIDNGRDFWTATTTPFIHYNFQLGRFVPYLGGSIGIVYNDRDITGVAGPNVGTKIFFDDQTFLNLGYRYDIYFNRLRDVDNHSNHGNHIFGIGIGFNWGGNRATTKQP